jgi:hypothetical protein
MMYFSSYLKLSLPILYNLIFMDNEIPTTKKVKVFRTITSTKQMQVA